MGIMKSDYAPADLEGSDDIRTQQDESDALTAASFGLGPGAGMTPGATDSRVWHRVKQKRRKLSSNRAHEAGGGMMAGKAGGGMMGMMGGGMMGGMGMMMGGM